MDPNLYRLNWERATEVLTTIVILSFLLERALSLLFEWRPFIKKFGGKGAKEPIVFVAALGICMYWHFDAISMIVLSDRIHFLGQLITAGVIAGGSKAAIKLFVDIMGFKSQAAEEQTEKKKKSVSNKL